MVLLSIGPSNNFIDYKVFKFMKTNIPANLLFDYTHKMLFFLPKLRK